MKENKLIAEFMGLNTGEYTSYLEESPTQYAVYRILIETYLQQKNKQKHLLLWLNYHN